MNNTTNNLKEAFAGRKPSQSKIPGVLQESRKEGFRNIATLFRTAAAAERIHAEGHLGATGWHWVHCRESRGCDCGETYEYTQMYPPMLKQAEAEGHKAKRMFDYAAKAEPSMLGFISWRWKRCKRGKIYLRTRSICAPSAATSSLGPRPRPARSARRRDRALFRCANCL